MSKVSEEGIKPCRVTPIHQHRCRFDCYTQSNSNTPLSTERRRLMKWARDYRRHRFSVWTSDEPNVNSLDAKGLGEGRDRGDPWIERSAH